MQNLTPTSPFVSSPVVLPSSHPALQFNYPLPYGAILRDDGVQFVVFSRSATAMRLLLYDKLGDHDPKEIISFDRDSDRWGNVWSVYVPGVKAGQLYHFQADGPHDPRRGHRFDPTARLIDPYARALAGDYQTAADGIVRPPKCVVVDESYNWNGDRHIRRDVSQTIIYEMHVKGFTRSKTSGVKNRGTYLGVIEKIPYLQSLGVTAVELMPVHEFPTNAPNGRKQARPNYWGYDPMAFFSPHRGYAVGREPGAQVNEFKQMVQALHAAGIEVILDVVFNHTAEGNHLGPTFSFKGLENSVYYMLERDGSYRNYSGCGNTVNGNHPIVRELIFHCLRHWVHNYHVDGFRFDLASILSRDRSGHLLPNPPMVEVIAEDPMLADTKIIAEAWDAAGAYQVGSFANKRWAEWNGRYRDDLRRYWRREPGMLGPWATRLCGSSDLYQHSGRSPYHSINFITSHDGFTLNDLVSYESKHNEANGEDNRDGENNNHSFNYGEEGPTRRKHIRKLRVRQIKNMFASLLLSQGTPMIVMGDEVRRTQRGNNNAYCQDNPISWMNWKLVERHADMLRFCRSLIQFRRRQPTVRRTKFLTGQPSRNGDLPDVTWYAVDGKPIEWNGAHSFSCVFSSTGLEDEAARHVMLLMHAGGRPLQFTFPDVAGSLPWRLFIDTAADPPHDIYPNEDGPPLEGKFVMLQHHSLRCYVSAD